MSWAEIVPGYPPVWFNDKRYDNHLLYGIQDFSSVGEALDQIDKNSKKKGFDIMPNQKVEIEWIPYEGHGIYGNVDNDDIILITTTEGDVKPVKALWAMSNADYVDAWAKFPKGYKKPEKRWIIVVKVTDCGRDGSYVHVNGKFVGNDGWLETEKEKAKMFTTSEEAVTAMREYVNKEIALMSKHYSTDITVKRVDETQYHIHEFYEDRSGHDLDLTVKLIYVRKED